MLGYLHEHRVKQYQRSDLYDIWPKVSCQHCYGTGQESQTVVMLRGIDRGQRTINICRCLSKQEDQLKRKLGGNHHEMV